MDRAAQILPSPKRTAYSAKSLITGRQKSSSNSPSNSPYGVCSPGIAMHGHRRDGIPLLRWCAHCVYSAHPNTLRHLCRRAPSMFIIESFIKYIKYSKLEHCFANFRLPIKRSALFFLNPSFQANSYRPTNRPLVHRLTMVGAAIEPNDRCMRSQFGRNMRHIKEQAAFRFQNLRSRFQTAALVAPKETEQF